MSSATDPGKPAVNRARKSKHRPLEPVSARQLERDLPKLLRQIAQRVCGSLCGPARRKCLHVTPLASEETTIRARAGL